MRTYETDHIYAMIRRIAGQVAGADVSVEGTTITMRMPDGTENSLTLPQPKDGVSVTGASIRDGCLYCSLSDGSEVSAGQLPVGGDPGSAEDVDFAGIVDDGGPRIGYNGRLRKFAAISVATYELLLDCTGTLQAGESVFLRQESVGLESGGLAQVDAEVIYYLPDGLAVRYDHTGKVYLANIGSEDVLMEDRTLNVSMMLPYYREVI